MNWTNWLKAAGVRALKTAGQAFVAAIVATGVVSAWEIDWLLILGIVVLAAALSFATSLGGLPELDKGEEH